MNIKKFFKWFGICLVSIVIIELITVKIISKNEITAFSSLKQINEKNKNYPFYTILNYNYDYDFDDYLKVGSKDINEDRQFIEKRMPNESIKNYKISVSEPKCSSFTAVTPNGDKLFARNFDTFSAVPLLLRTNPNNGNKSISMVNLVNLGYKKENTLDSFLKENSNLLLLPYVPIDGMNEHGLAVSVLTAGGSSASIKSNKITLNDLSVMRLIMDKASTVNQAVSMIKNYNMSFSLKNWPSHFMIADDTGESVVVEYINGKLQTVYSDKPYNVVTNFILYNNPDHKGFGDDRYKKIKKGLDKTNGVMTEKQAIKLLSENTMVGYEQWSIVYNLTKKMAYICVGKDYKTIYTFGINN